MKYETAQELSAKDFKRRTGVYKQTFKRMLDAWRTYHLGHSNAGRPPKLCRPDQLLVALQYWREYRTYFHIAGDWEVSESTVCRIVQQVETVLMNSGLFRLPGKKLLLQGFERPDVVVIDVTETPCKIARTSAASCIYLGGKIASSSGSCPLLILVAKHCLTHLKPLYCVISYERKYYFCNDINSGISVLDINKYFATSISFGDARKIMLKSMTRRCFSLSALSVYSRDLGQLSHTFGA